MKTAGTFVILPAKYFYKKNSNNAIIEKILN
jgi:hypothetical protein